MSVHALWNPGCGAPGAITQARGHPLATPTVAIAAIAGVLDIFDGIDPRRVTQQRGTDRHRRCDP
jgi:hypothetical protein